MTWPPALQAAWRSFRQTVHRTTAWFGPVASSVRGKINGDEAKRIAAKVAVTATAAGSVWAGLGHAAHDPEVVTAAVGFITVLLGAVFEGIHRYHDGPPKPPHEDPPVPLPKAWP